MKNRAGKIYILRNPYLKDAVVKIGRTSRISEVRAKEISGSTGVPYEFEVLYEEDVFDSNLAEKVVHEKLSRERINPHREFFRMPLKKAVKVVFETCLQVNRHAAKAATTRVIIVVSPAHGKMLVQQMAEVLSKHKGGKVEVYILYQGKNADALIKIGDERNTRLSAELVNNLRKFKGVKDVLWASKDMRAVDQHFLHAEALEF